MILQILDPVEIQEIPLPVKRSEKVKLSPEVIAQIWQYQKRYSQHNARGYEWQKWELLHGESARSSLCSNKIGLYTDFT